MGRPSAKPLATKIPRSKHGYVMNLSIVDVAYGLVAALHCYLTAIGSQQERHGAKWHEGAWQHDIIGFTGEVAFAKFCGVYYDGNTKEGRYEDGDVCGVQVRTVAKYPALRIHKDDNDDDIFVLVEYSGRMVCKIHGWIRAKEAKIDDNWGKPMSTRPAAFFVQWPDLNRDFSEVFARMGLAGYEKERQPMKLVKDGKDLFVFPDNEKQGEWIKKNFEGRKSRTFKARYVDKDGKPAVQLRLVPEKE